MKTHRLQIGLALWVLMSILALLGHAQDPGMKEKFAQAQKQNTAALRQLTWKSRTTLNLKGETKKVKLDQVFYDAQGQQQKQSLDDPSQQADAQQQGGGGRRSGRLKQKMIEKKRKSSPS